MTASKRNLAIWLAFAGLMLAAAALAFPAGRASNCAEASLDSQPGFIAVGGHSAPACIRIRFR